MFARVTLFICLLLWGIAAEAAQTILIFGDSLSSAYGISRNESWVSLLEQRVHQQKPGYRVINVSISGETTSGGRYRIDKALDEFHPAVVIVELGANDGLRGLPLDEAFANLDAIITACRRHKAKVLLVGMRLPPNYGTAYISKFQKMYEQLALRHRIPLMPFLLEGFADKAELFQADGLHPTAAAQPLITARLWTHLEPLLASSR